MRRTRGFRDKRGLLRWEQWGWAIKADRRPLCPGPICACRRFRRADDFPQVREVDLCGSISGRDVDKFAACGFHALPGTRVSAPLIEECPINIECVTRHRLSLGAHDLLIGEIVAVHYDEEVLDSRGRLQPGKVGALAYLHGEYWSLGAKLGSHGFTRKEPQGGATE